MTGTIPVPMFRSGNNSSIYGCVSIRILNNLHATNKNLFAKSKDLYLSSPTWKYSCKLQYYKIQTKSAHACPSIIHRLFTTHSYFVRALHETNHIGNKLVIIVSYTYECLAAHMWYLRHLETEAQWKHWWMKSRQLKQNSKTYMYVINHLYELQIKNRSESGLHSCGVT